MLTSLAQFDPITFLGIDTSTYSPEEIDLLRQDLMKQIGEYVLLSFSDQISLEAMQTLSQETDGTKILTQLRSLIPEFDTHMLTYIEQFKMEYQLETQNLTL